MQRAFEKIIERLEDKREIAEKEMEKCIFKGLPYHDSTEGKVIGIKNAIEIVNQVASEYGGGWIPVSSGKLPDCCDTYLCTAKWLDETVELYYRMRDNSWVDIYECEYEVIAWQYKPEPYKESEEQGMRDKCSTCKHNDIDFDCSKCGYKPKTNADKIRAMSDEELAEFLESFEVCTNCEYADGKLCTFENPCTHGFATAIAMKWLQSEVEEQA